MTTDVWVYGHWKAEVVILPVKVIKVVSPKILDILWVNPSMRIRSFLDEHHGRKIVEVPIRWDFHKTCVRPLLEWFHPMVWMFGVVNGSPTVAGP